MVDDVFSSWRTLFCELRRVFGDIQLCSTEEEEEHEVVELDGMQKFWACVVQ